MDNKAYLVGLLLALEKLTEVAASLAVDYAFASGHPLSFDHFTELLTSIREAKDRLKTWS